MKKIVVCLAVAFLFGFVSFSNAEFKSQYNNKVVYNQPTYIQPAYVNNDGYNNNVNYIEEFIQGEQRQQMVQKTDRSGRTVQAVVPVGVPEEDVTEE